jgi:hypothetical protein
LRIGVSGWKAWHVQDVAEDDEFERVAARRAPGGVEPVDVPGQQRDQLLAQLAKLFRRREGDRLQGLGDVLDRLGVTRPDQLETADTGQHLFQHGLRQRGGRPGKRRVIRDVVE